MEVEEFVAGVSVRRVVSGVLVDSVMVECMYNDGLRTKVLKGTTLVH